MNLPIPALLCAIAFSTARCFAQQPDLIINDFEGPDYGAWKVEGTAFGAAPAQGKVAGQNEVTGYAGHGLANSFLGGDKATGKLTSPEFKIERPYITFLIGGGGFEGKTCINLLVDGKVARTATGPNTEPGGNERLEPASWDVSELVGKTARIEIVDNATCGWGHINVDQILQTATKPEIFLKQVSREVVVINRLLHFPIKAGAGKRVVTLSVDGKPESRFEIELADAEPDWWAPIDVSAWKGKTLSVRAFKLPECSKALDSLRQADEIIAENCYHEPLRPQFHFTSRRGWLNDPNGLVYYKGQWHLFYQHNPIASYNSTGYFMHWGHAVSKDLVHWDELPIALSPNEKGDCWTGACFVDWKNQLGLKNGADDVIVAFYLRSKLGLSYAYSTDGGRVWNDYPGNPLVKPRYGRVDSPKPIWYEPTQRWIAPTYDHEKFDGKVAETVNIYSSADLKIWQPESNLGPVGLNAECPEMFELPVDDNPQKRMWVMVCGNGQYFVGNFDGKTMTNRAGEPVTTKDYLKGIAGNYYATMTWSDVPKEDGRRIQIAWMAGSFFAGMPFSQQMTFPVALSLRTTEDGVRLFWNPVKEIETLYAKSHVIPAHLLAAGEEPIPNVSGDLFDISAEFEPGDASEVGFLVRGEAVVYDAKHQVLVCRKVSLPLKPMDGKVRLRLLVDRGSIEAFGNDGRVYLSLAVPFRDEERTLRVLTKGGNAKINALEVHELKSAWQ